MRANTIAWLHSTVNAAFLKEHFPKGESDEWVLNVIRSVGSFLQQPRERHPDKALQDLVTLVTEVLTQARCDCDAAHCTTAAPAPPHTTRSPSPAARPHPHPAPPSPPSLTAHAPAPAPPSPRSLTSTPAGTRALAGRSA